MASALAEEIARFLLQNAQGLGGVVRRNVLLADFLSEVERIGPEVASRDSVIFARATIAMARNDTAAVRFALTSSHFPTLWGARSELASLWMEAAYYDHLVALGGHELSAVQRHQVRLHAAVPASIGPFVYFPRVQPNARPK
eukprot:COSAG05_NODE_697_length_7869_cov_14.189937_9_plen_142_part_00